MATELSDARASRGPSGAAGVTARPSAYPGTDFAEWALRGIGLVVLQSNPLSGAFILAALLLNSLAYGLGCAVGTIIGTLAAMALGADRDRLREGLYGFNGALTGIALVAFTSRDFLTGSMPGFRLWLFIALAAAASTILVRAFAELLGHERLPGLTFPFCAATWFFLGALQQLTAIDVSPALHPALAVHAAVSPAYSWETWAYGTINGIAEIFLQDGWIAGLLILLAIAINSQIAALMAVLGSLLAVGVGVTLGAPETVLRAGMYSYNAALTGIALGGFFVLLRWPGFLYAVFGILVTACGWAAISTVFKPLGMPVLAFPFVIVTWLMLLAAKGFPVLVAIPPAEAGTAEDNLARYRERRTPV